MESFPTKASKGDDFYFFLMQRRSHCTDACAPVEPHVLASRPEWGPYAHRPFGRHNQSRTPQDPLAVPCRQHHNLSWKRVEWSWTGEVPGTKVHLCLFDDAWDTLKHVMRDQVQWQKIDRVLRRSSCLRYCTNRMLRQHSIVWFWGRCRPWIRYLGPGPVAHIEGAGGGGGLRPRSSIPPRPRAIASSSRVTHWTVTCIVFALFSCTLAFVHSSMGFAGFWAYGGPPECGAHAVHDAGLYGAG